MEKERSNLLPDERTNYVTQENNSINEPILKNEMNSSINLNSTANQIFNTQENNYLNNFSNEIKEPIYVESKLDKFTLYKIILFLIIKNMKKLHLKMIW